MVPEPATYRRATRRNPEAVAFGSLVVLLVVAYAGALCIARVGYAPLSDLVAPTVGFPLSAGIRVHVLPTFLIDVVGVGLGAWVYARARGLDLPWRLPPKDRLRITVATLLVVPALVAIAALVGDLVFETRVVSLTGSRYAPETRLAHLVVPSFVPSVLTGVGYGLAFYGVVHRRVREVTTPRHAIVLTPLLLGCFWEARDGIQHVFRWSPSLPEIARVLVVLVATVAFASSLGLLYRGAFRAPVEHLLRARYVPILAFGLFGAIVLIAGVADLTDALRLAAFGVAAYGYERTRSIWVPILVLAILPASLDLATWLDSTRPPY